MRVETAVINALKGIGMPSRITPILSDRDGVEPSSPYLLINIISVLDKNVPRRTVSHEEGNKVERVIQTKDYLISFTFHIKSNDPVHDWVQRFQTGISSDLYDYAFAQQGLGLVTTRGIMYQPSPVQGENYKRAIIDIVFRAEVVEAFFVNDIKKVTIRFCDNNLPPSTSVKNDIRWGRVSTFTRNINPVVAVDSNSFPIPIT